MALFNKNFLKIIIFLFTLILIVSSIFYMQINLRENELLDEIHNSISKRINKDISTLIEDKKNATSLLSVSLSKNYKIIDALENKKFDFEQLKELSLDLRNNTNYKNVWIQVRDKNDEIKFQSWNDKIFKASNSRKYNNTSKEVETIVSLNEFDLSFSSTISIFKKEEFLGTLEVNTKFNSICEILKKEKLECAVLVDKKYRDTLKIPFSNTFIDDFYIANVNLDKTIFEYLRNSDLENILSIKNYKILDDYFIKTYKIEKDLGTILIFKDKKSIDINSIKNLKINAYSLFFITIVLSIFLIIVYSYKVYYKNISILNKELLVNLGELTYQKNKTQLLLDSQSNIIVITDGKEIIEANKQLLVFYKKFKSLEEFKKEYICVCTTFVNFNDETDYILDIDYDGNNWAEHILANKDKSFKAAIYDSENNLHHFALKVSNNNVDDFMIVTLTDITSEIKSKEELKNFNDKLEQLVSDKTIELKELNENLEKRIEKEIQVSKEKDIMIFEQNKMTSISQLLHNIAHQWRQPLSVISSASSGMKLQKELDVLDDKFFFSSCDMIVEKANYLSNTIEDFTNFFAKNKKVELKSLKKIVNQCSEYLTVILRENAINLVIDIKDDINIPIYENEFKQAILHILNNSVNAFNKKGIKDRLILITFESNNLIIKDSAEGIDESIINNVFEPYFTTAHQSLGTGMGLYIVREILLKHMNFMVKIKNCKFEYEQKEYKGLSFIISLHT